jgi:hypothetical protein
MPIRKEKKSLVVIPDDLLLAGGVGDNRLGIGGGGGGGGATGKFIREPSSEERETKSIFLLCSKLMSCQLFVVLHTSRRNPV